MEREGQEEKREGRKKVLKGEKCEGRNGVQEIDPKEVSTVRSHNVDIRV